MNQPSPTSLRGTTSGLERAVAVLEYLADHSPTAIGVSMVSRDLDLPKAVAHRILKELTVLRLLTFDDATKRYRLGAGALNLGLAAARGVDALDVAGRHLSRLTALTDETATFSVRQGDSRVYLDQVLSPHEVRMSVTLGSRHPLHAGSSSKAILAALPDDELEAYLAGFRPTRLTEATITSVAVLRGEVEEIRRRGFAWSRAERQVGAGSVAAAVVQGDGDVVGALSVCGPQERFSDEVVEEYGRYVETAAREASLELGFAGSTLGTGGLRVR